MKAIRAVERTCGGHSCELCGCTDHAACEGGCFWITPTLCSSCAHDCGIDEVYV